MKKIHTFTREELYQLVWQTPLQRLARQYSLSDVGLAKICRKIISPFHLEDIGEKLRQKRKLLKDPY